MVLGTGTFPTITAAWAAKASCRSLLSLGMARSDKALVNRVKTSALGKKAFLLSATQEMKASSPAVWRGRRAEGTAVSACLEAALAHHQKCVSRLRHGLGYQTPCLLNQH